MNSVEATAPDRRREPVRGEAERIAEFGLVLLGAAVLAGATLLVDKYYGRILPIWPVNAAAVAYLNTRWPARKVPLVVAYALGCCIGNLGLDVGWARACASARLKWA